MKNKLKSIINSIAKNTGYQFVKIPSLDLDLSRGKYEWLQQLKVKTIIDIGANDGQFVRFISKVLKDVKIYSFEPINECYLNLLKLKNEIDSLEVFNFAIGEDDNESTFFQSEFSASSSLLEMANLHTSLFPHTQNHNKKIVSVKKLDAFRDKMPIEPRLLIKIDVQGYENKVLKGGKEFLKLADIIIIETSYFELYKNQWLFYDLNEYLYSEGFFFSGNLEQITAPQNNLTIQADAIYFKNEMRDLTRW